jgi:hypothetical protein
MAEQSINIKIKVDKQGNVELKSLEKGFDKIKITAKQASQAAKQLGVDISKIQSSGNINVAANDFNKLSKAIGGADAATGGATATVLEFGRVVSDAPYGIRGVANNLQQLASNFTFMAKQAGGAGAALKAMGSALMGPLGLLVAFQAVIAAFDYFSQSSSVAESKFKDLSSEIASSTSELMILKRAMDDENVTQSQRIELVEDANRKYKDLNVSLDENGKLTDASVEAINRKIFALERLARANAIQIAIEEEMQKTITAQLEVEELLRESSFESREEFEKYLEASRKATTRSEAIALQKKQFGEYTTTRGRQIGAIVEALSNLDETTDLSDKKIKDLIKIASKGMEEIRDIIDDEDKGGIGGVSNRRFKQQLLDLQKFINTQYKKEFSLREINQVELLKNQQEYEKKDLLIRLTSFKRKQKLRYDEFMASNATDEAKAKAKLDYYESIRLAENEHQEALTSLEYLHSTKRFNQQLELVRKFNADMLKLRGELARTRAGSVGTDTSTGRLNRPQSDVGAENIENIIAAQETVGVLREEEFQEALVAKEQQLRLAGFTDLQIKMELRQMQHAFDIETMDQEIELERMKIESKKQINLEYVSWVGGLSDVFKGIAGENEGLAKAALVLEKGSKIAKIIIDTTAANQTVMVAASARAMAGDPTAIGLGKTRVLKNKIGAGISIAKIAATTLQSRGGAGGGGGAGDEGGGRTFDFNLVGSTGQDQLAQTVGGQFGQGPVQAYVVSSQITSQQQLDNMIESDATFGGED